jgi:Permeases of the drug/metabolite transporter (DMT) superfamily
LLRPFLGAGVVLAQLGLRTVDPLSGAAISVPSFTLLFLLLSPLSSRANRCLARPADFLAIGLFFPASLTLLPFASNRALGPVITSTLGNLAPLFAVATAVILLHEPLHPPQLLGLVVAVAGAAIITVTRPRDLGHWRSWALLLPLCSALVRGVVPPIVKLGLAVWPSALWACLIGYITSSLVVLTVQRVRKGSFVVQAPRARLVLVRDDRDQQRLERAHAVCRRPQRPHHAGGAARRDLSAGHGGAERDGAEAYRDHRADRRWDRADRARRGAGADRLIRCGIGNTPLLPVQLCNGRFACQNDPLPENFVKAPDQHTYAHPAWLILILSLAPTIGLGIGRFAYALVLPDMRDALGWSYSAAGFMNTINAVGYLAGALLPHG